MNYYQALVVTLLAGITLPWPWITAHHGPGQCNSSLQHPLPRTWFSWRPPSTNTACPASCLPPKRTAFFWGQTAQVHQPDGTIMRLPSTILGGGCSLLCAQEEVWPQGNLGTDWSQMNHLEKTLRPLLNTHTPPLVARESCFLCWQWTQRGVNEDFLCNPAINWVKDPTTHFTQAIRVMPFCHLWHREVIQAETFHFIKLEKCKCSWEQCYNTPLTSGL